LQLATGGWQLANCTSLQDEHFSNISFISIYFFLLLAIGG